LGKAYTYLRGMQTFLYWLCTLWLTVAQTNYNVPPRTRFKYTCPCSSATPNRCYIQSGQLCAPMTQTAGVCPSNTVLCPDIVPANLVATQLSNGQTYYRISMVPNPYIPTSRAGIISLDNTNGGTAAFTYADGGSEDGVPYNQISAYPCATYLDVGNTFASVGACVALFFLSVMFTGCIVGK